MADIKLRETSIQVTTDLGGKLKVKVTVGADAVEMTPDEVTTYIARLKAARTKAQAVTKILSSKL